MKSCQNPSVSTRSVRFGQEYDLNGGALALPRASTLHFFSLSHSPLFTFPAARCGTDILLSDRDSLDPERMTEQADGPIESVMEKISEKIHAHDSSSDSETEAESKESARAKIYRLFGRERPVHKVLGGGKSADVMLWKNKKVSAGVVGLATAIWVLFELAEYHLLTLVCHILIVSLAVLFLWSNARTFVNKNPPRIPEVHLPEDIFRDVASVLTMEINQAFAFLRDVATGKDLKKFLIVIASLWVLSILGTWCNFLTLFYILFVLLHTIPFIYDKYEDKVDPFAEKAMFEIKKQYAVFDAKVLSKIPVGGLKAKRV